MLKVLLVSPDWPYPEHKNGVAKIVANLLVRNNNFEADLLYIGDPPGEEDYGFGVRRIPSPPQYSTLKKICKFAFSELPFNTWIINDSLKQVVGELRRIHQYYDVIHLLGPGFATLSDYSNEEFFKKVVFSPIDSIGLHFERRKKLKPFGLKRILFSIESSKCKLFEIRHYQKFRQVSFVSDVDSSWIAMRLKNGNFPFVPNGVDTDYFSPSMKLRGNGRFNLIFTGNMDYAPNEDAALFLIDHIFPFIEKKHDINLFIVGSNPSTEIKRRCRENIHVTGFVPDIRGYLHDATIYVSPLREGSGIKNKILEAMSAGQIVVGTPISFEGISVINGKHCIIADANEKAFSDAVSLVLENLEGYSQIRAASRELIESNYSWIAIRERYSELYRKVLF